MTKLRGWGADGAGWVQKREVWELECGLYCDKQFVMGKSLDMALFR